MKAVVNTPVCPLMLEPRPDCELADEALYGMVVEVLEETASGYCRVRTPYRYEGYAPADCLLTHPDRAAAWEALAPGHTPWSKGFVDVLAQPKYRSYPLITLPRGARILCGGAEDGWTRVTLADGREGWVRTGWVEPWGGIAGVSEADLRRRLCQTARLYRGTAYRWGGKTPLGIDCSGLVSMAYLLNGIVIYRDAHIKPGFELVEIQKEEMAPADLLFFPGHVAMYLGEGRYLHSTGKAGSDGVCVNSLDPADPLYREDLARSITQVGSYTGFHR